MQNYDYITCKFRLTTLTPLHIGSGKTLVRDYDYFVDEESQQTWRLNEDALLDEQEAENVQQAHLLALTPPGKLFEAYPFQEQKRFIRYAMPGIPEAEDAAGGKLHECIKDKDDKPYLPGTTLKGALRTAIGWYGWQQKGLTPNTKKLQERHGRWKRKEFAAQSFEHDIFGNRPSGADGSDASYDLMRALHVGDSGAITRERLQVVNAMIYRRDRKTDNRVTSLEAIASQTSDISIDIKIDTALFSEWAKELRFMDKKVWLTDLTTICKEYSEARIAYELSCLDELKDMAWARAAAKFYREEMKAYPPGENGFWLQIGWGTGWNGKTFGSNLRTSEEFMKEIIGGYRLGQRHQYRASREFPLSRRLPRIEANGIPALPLGWVLVEMLPKEQQ